MSKVLVLYYSRTGNTEKMAQAVADGIRAVKGAEVELTYFVEPENLVRYDALAVGIPTYHHDMTADVKTLFEQAAAKNVNLKGKVATAFGSYGWSGEAPGLVLEIMQNRFGMDIVDPPLLAKYKPDSVALERCKALGRAVAEKLMP